MLPLTLVVEIVMLLVGVVDKLLQLIAIVEVFLLWSVVVED